MFYKNSCWKCILNYSCGIFQSDSSLAGCRSRADYCFLKALTLDPVYASPQIVKATPTSHCVCPPPPQPSMLNTVPRLTKHVPEASPTSCPSLPHTHRHGTDWERGTSKSSTSSTGTRRGKTTQPRNVEEVMPPGRH